MDRAQAHTLEAFTAALLVVSAVVFALQATAVTPLTASTSNQHIENQEKAIADDLLSVTAADGRLREAVLYWDTTSEQFVGSNDEGVYANGGPPNAFGDVLNTTFGNVSMNDPSGDVVSTRGRIAYNVFVVYRLPNGESRQQTMVYMGSPSDNAVVATRTVTLFDGESSSERDDSVAACRSMEAILRPGGVEEDRRGRQRRKSDISVQIHCPCRRARNCRCV